MGGQSSGAFMLTGDDTVPASGVGRTGMWLGAVEAKHVAWAREPHLVFAGKQFPTVKIAEQTYQAESDIVLVCLDGPGQLSLH